MTDVLAFPVLPIVMDSYTLTLNISKLTRVAARLHH